MRKELKFGDNKILKPEIDRQSWESPYHLPQATNVVPDLAIAMKYNPDLKVLLSAGYFDLATPFYEGI